MGYTHYWTPKAADDNTWKVFVAACKKLYEALPETSETAGGYHTDDKIVICGFNGTGKPEFRLSGVAFNGDGEKGLDHESFVIEKEKDEWNFCKTARKPYDLLVCACLIAAKDILGYKVTSDGNFEEWRPAIEFYLNTFYEFDDTPDEDMIESILPEFLFEEQEGSTYREPYNLMESLFN